MIERKFFPYQQTEREEVEGENEERFFRFRVLQYNILAQGLINRKKKHKYLPKAFARFKFRKKSILKEVCTYRAEINCFQEMDHYDDFWKRALEREGYSSIYTTTESNPLKKKCPWGLCIAYSSKLELIESKKINFNDLVKDLSNSELEKRELSISHHICLIAVFKIKAENTDVNKYLIVANLHLFWRPTFGWVKMRHLIRIQKELNSLTTKYGKDNVTSFVCGDFNISPNDLPYILFSKNRDLSLVQKSHFFNFPQYVDEQFEISKSEDTDFEDLIKKRNESMMNKLEEFKKISPIFWNSVYSTYTLIDTNFQKDERYGNEPAFTHYVHDYQSTLDYIFLINTSGKCEIKKILELPKLKEAIPNGYFCSDHLCISAEFRINF